MVTKSILTLILSLAEKYLILWETEREDVFGLDLFFFFKRETVFFFPHFRKRTIAFILVLAFLFSGKIGSLFLLGKTTKKKKKKKMPHDSP